MQNYIGFFSSKLKWLFMLFFMPTVALAHDGGNSSGIMHDSDEHMMMHPLMMIFLLIFIIFILVLVLKYIKKNKK